MKECGWSLLLDGYKVTNIRSLREHFDTAALVGYLRGGSLGKWLSDIGEADILRKISEISPDEDDGIALQHIFGVNPDIKYTPSPKTAPADFASTQFSGSSFTNSFTGTFSGSFTNALTTGSFASGSFASGSFAKTSFRTGISGSGYGSGNNFGSFSSSFVKNGSFCYMAGKAVISEQEYKRTMINLSSCPLNEYGYGIHLI